MCGSVLIRVTRSVNNFHTGAPAACLGQSHDCTGHTQQITEGANGHLSFQCQPKSFVNKRNGRHTNGTTGSRYELNVRRQEFTNTETESFMCMSTANFHNPNRLTIVRSNNMLCFFIRRHYKSSRRVSVSSTSSAVILAMATPA